LDQTSLTIQHLLLRLRPLNRRLRLAVEHQRLSAQRFAEAGLASLCVTDAHVAALLEDIDSLSADANENQCIESAHLNASELDLENQLRREAAGNNFTLPFDLLANSLQLNHLEETAILVSIAPEVERSYGRIFGYILDDLNRQQPSPELICLVATDSNVERLAFTQSLGRYSRLRRAGVLQPVGEATLETRQGLRLAPALVDLLLGGHCDLKSFQDPDEMIIPADVVLPPDVQPQVIDRLSNSLRTQQVTVVGIWGPRFSGKDEVVAALAQASQVPLRRFTLKSWCTAAESADSVRQSFLAAGAVGAGLWIETDWLQDPEFKVVQEGLVQTIAVSDVPIFLTGVHPWRPAQVLESRAYTELELATPGFHVRKKMWSSTVPEALDSQVSSLAGRFRMTRGEMRAALQLARTAADLNGNVAQDHDVDRLETACSTVTRRRSDHFARTVKPTRHADDLILPDDVHKQVIEIARFYKASSIVDEEWGFGRMSSSGGVKVLFTGEPGTGKTLAAEVIAGIVRLPLLKVDLARVISKWVGETEKNLDTVFREAEESHAVLFFDEADSLFGKRAEVQHGTDRYANLEVGFLLQRLEDYFGLVILASNLKDQIDPAFTRRFHVIVHFPIPRVAERRRIWQLAFPTDAPTDGSVDLDMLQQLDMTGAGIVSAARTAALLAADENRSAISMSHVVRGVARQFHREARILSPALLGRHGTLLQSAP